MSDLQYKNSNLSGNPENPVKTTNQLDLGSGSFRGAAAPWSLNAGGSSQMEAGGRGGPRSIMSDWMASAGLLGERFSPINSMMSGLTSSDVSAGLRGVEKTPTGGNFLGLGLGGKDTAQSKYGTSSIWGGGGLGLGGSAWDGKSEGGTQYKGYSGGLGGVGNLGYDWNAGGFGQGGNYNLYRGVGGSAYSMDGGGKHGYGAEGSYTPIGLANSTSTTSLGPLGKGQVGVENAYLNKQSVSGQAYVDDNGKYVAEGMYAKRMGADNVTAHAENGLGTADASIGHTSKGMEVKGDAFYDNKTGSFGAGGSWNGGGYKVQDAKANVNLGNGLVKADGSMGTWDTGDSYGGRAGWDAEKRTAYAEGFGNWGGSTLENAKTHVDVGNGAATYDASIGKYVTSGHDLKGRVGYNAKDGVVEANGNYRGGGAQVDNAAVSGQVRGLGSVDAKLGHFSNDLIVKDVNARLGLREGEVSVGKIDGGGFRMNNFEAKQRNELLGTTTTAGFEELGSTNSISGAKVGYDFSSWKNAAVRGGFDDVSYGGYSGKNLHAGIDGPGDTSLHAGVGSFNQGFSGQGGSFELSREKGLALGLKQGRFDQTVVNDVNIDAKLGNLYQAKAHLGEGYYQHFGGKDVKAGIDGEKGLYASLRDGEYRYAGGKDLDVSSSLGNGAVGQHLKVGEATVGGVDIGKLQYNSTLQNANLSAQDVGAHGAKIKDLAYQANVGKLGGGLDAKQLNVADLSIGNLDAHTKNFGLTGNAQADKVKFDAVNIENGHAGLNWGGKEFLGASGSYRSGAGVDQAKLDYDVLSGKAGGSFKNANLGAQMKDAHLNLFGHDLALPDMGAKLNASGGANVDLAKGAANANLNLAGSGINIGGHNFQLGNWAQASAGVNASQGAANFNLGGKNGVGADMNLSQGNLDLNVFGHKIDVDEGIRSVGRGIAGAGRAIGSAASSAWHSITSW